ncbi:hypothetical protein Tco_0528975 [Tanacetum coccineum]
MYKSKVDVSTASPPGGVGGLSKKDTLQGSARHPGIKTARNKEKQEQRTTTRKNCAIKETPSNALGLSVMALAMIGVTKNFMPPKHDLVYPRLDDFVEVNKPASESVVEKPIVETNELHGNPQQDLKDKGVIDSGCSRHMTRNRSYLTDYEEIDEGFVAFRGNSKGGKITEKDFKLTDKSHVLLKVLRKDNMYNVDLKNVVPQGGLTYLFAKATPDESNLWHRRLGHDETSEILKTFISCIENLIDLKVKVIRCDNETEFKNKVMNQFCEMKGYSTNSKAFKVFNSRTRIIEENLHVQFSKNTPNISGSGPNWLFDIDALTKSMNYKPVVAGNQSNGSTGSKACDNAGKARMETIPDKYYILLPLSIQEPPFSSSSKDSPDAGFKPSREEEKKDAKDPGNESGNPTERK